MSSFTEEDDDDCLNDSHSVFSMKCTKKPQTVTNFAIKDRENVENVEYLLRLVRREGRINETRWLVDI